MLLCSCCDNLVKCFRPSFLKDAELRLPNARVRVLDEGPLSGYMIIDRVMPGAIDRLRRRIVVRSQPIFAATHLAPTV